MVSFNGIILSLTITMIVVQLFIQKGSCVWIWILIIVYTSFLKQMHTTNVLTCAEFLLKWVVLDVVPVYTLHTLFPPPAAQSLHRLLFHQRTHQQQQQCCHLELDTSDLWSKPKRQRIFNFIYNKISLCKDYIIDLVFS